MSTIIGSFPGGVWRFCPASVLTSSKRNHGSLYTERLWGSSQWWRVIVKKAVSRFPKNQGGISSPIQKCEPFAGHFTVPYGRTRQIRGNLQLGRFDLATTSEDAPEQKSCLGKQRFCLRQCCLSFRREPVFHSEREPEHEAGLRAVGYLGHLASSELSLGKLIYGDVGNRQIEIRQSPVRIVLNSGVQKRNCFLDPACLPVGYCQINEGVSLLGIDSHRLTQRSNRFTESSFLKKVSPLTESLTGFPWR